MCNVAGIYIWGHVSYVKEMHTSAPGDILIALSSYEIYADRVVSYWHVK